MVPDSSSIVDKMVLIKKKMNLLSGIISRKIEWFSTLRCCIPCLPYLLSQAI